MGKEIENEFNRILEYTDSLALSTAKSNSSNVRVLNYLWKMDEKVVYICTPSDMPKVQELADNPNVAFVTLPNENLGVIEFVKVKEAIAFKSHKPKEELTEMFCNKYPSFTRHIFHSNDMIFYELKFRKAFITLGHAEFETLEITG